MSGECVFLDMSTDWCDDGIDCTADSCDGSNPDEYSCTNEPDDAACDDGDDCTADSCDAELGCVNENIC
jgi:hypothetical protein